jgi:clan AA aspartic protease (TIGR02281 family)
MQRIVVAVLTAALLLTASLTLARKAQVAVQGSGKVLIVEASINQRLSGRFVLDTGASYCVVTKETAKDAGLSGRTDGRKVQMATANGAIVEATLGQARRIDMGDAVARDVDIAIVDRDPTPGFMGLIGLSFLQNFKYSVDSSRGVLLLEN